MITFTDNPTPDAKSDARASHATEHDMNLHVLVSQVRGSRRTADDLLKRQWYEDNGCDDRLITSEDGLDGSIDAARIEQIARERILEE